MDDHPVNFYANAVNITSSIYDISLAFKSQAPQIDNQGNVMLIKDQPVVNVADELIVRMSPQHAKALAAILVKHIKQYEKQFGVELPLPPDMKILWGECTAKEK